MPIISICTGNFCREELVIQDIHNSLGYKIIKDIDVAVEAGKHFNVPENKISKAFSSRVSVFNRFSHEKETHVAYIKYTLGKMVEDDNLIIAGLCSQLIPDTISHTMKVCLIADMKFRINIAAENGGLSEKDAIKNIRNHDEDCIEWFRSIHSQKDPWDASLYDLVIPMDKVSVEKAGSLIEENLVKEALRPTDKSIRAVEDFRLSGSVQLALAREGHNVGVTSEAGKITLTINKHVLMLSRLEEELTAIAEKVQGVQSVETRVGKEFHQSDIYRKHNFEMPSKVLLVDDERDFIQTLSERLELREMGSAVAYDGESALNLIKDDEPEIMIIDLKMPGINGLEVLKQVKKTRPQIEVIVLTGHGADADKEQCIALGAFGYLQKPVDINELSEMLKKAHEKINRLDGNSAN